MSTRARSAAKKKAPPKTTRAHSTRSGGKGVNTSDNAPTEKATTKATGKKAPKRKMSDAPADKANKRVHKKVQLTNTAGARGSNETTNHAASPPEQAAHQPVIAAKRSGRKALPRPALSLNSESEEDDQDHSSVEENESDTESDMEVTTHLTVANLREEYPMPAETVATTNARQDRDDNQQPTTTNNNDQQPMTTTNNQRQQPTAGGGNQQPAAVADNLYDDQGGKRLEKILNEVPVLSHPAAITANSIPTALIQPTCQPVYSPPQNTVLVHPPNITLPLEPVIIPPPTFHALPPVWPAITDLVRRDDGHYRQSNQIPEIQACLSATVQRANSNLVFCDGFPDANCKGQWLAQALRKELDAHKGRSTTMAAVNDRANHSTQYFNHLQSMVMYLGDGDEVVANEFCQITGRWSGFRQGVINMARALIVSHESTYGLRGDPDPENVIDPQEVPRAASDLLAGDAYHFVKTAAGVVDTTTPYQHLEIAVALAFYFRGRDAAGILFKENMPAGKYGLQVPDAMVALTAMAIQVALEEKVAGRASNFSEKAHRDKYRSHMLTINAVKAWSDDGLGRHARMMSTIYKRTMDYLANGRSVAKPASTVAVDIGRMAV